MIVVPLNRSLGDQVCLTLHNKNKKNKTKQQPIQWYPEEKSSQINKSSLTKLAFDHDYVRLLQADHWSLSGAEGNKGRVHY